MKTIKELANVDSQLWADGYNKCKKDVLKLIDEIDKTYWEDDLELINKKELKQKIQKWDGNTKKKTKK